ncbi:hypothetical protein QBC45DRAFT_66676 [Copromyces sp. CBS 386.78]|nr:hypothetical protein QBC45DRAFT_66676 [Copromyces sp. CBS 386.78]
MTTANSARASHRPKRQTEKRPHANKPSKTKRPTQSVSEDTHIWEDMSTIYGNGFVSIISPQRPGVLGLVEKSLAYMGVEGHRRARPSSDKDFGFMVNFGDIQRMYMRYLHTKLLNIAAKVQHRSHMHDPKSRTKFLRGMHKLGPVLRQYVHAVQNHEYMTKFALKPNDPFVATSRRYHDRFLFERACLKTGLALEDCLPVEVPSEQPVPSGPQTDTNTPEGAQEDLRRSAIDEDLRRPAFAIDEEHELEQGRQRQQQWIDGLVKASIPTGPWETFPDGDFDTPASGLINTRTTSAKKAFWERVGAAVIGGAFLITPMWILALQRQLFLHLGVATGFVTAFGLTVSLYLETVEGVFTATLGYAAVIMVFVGVVLEGASGQGK